MVVSHDHGLDLNNGYVAISSPFKSSKIVSKILWEVASHLKSHSQVNKNEGMTLGQLDLIFYLIENIKY